MTQQQFSPEQIKKLHKLAEARGLQLQYQSTFGTQPVATPEAIVAIVGALGHPVRNDLTDLDRALDQAMRETFLQLSEPVVVVWHGDEIKLPIRTPVAFKTSVAQVRLRLEDGQIRKLDVNLSRLPVRRRYEHGDDEFIERIARFDEELPLGYHSLHVTVGNREQQVMVISAPRRAYRNPNYDVTDRLTGVFAPLHALHSQRSWGIGDFRDMSRFIHWAYEAGCDFVGTLPIFAGFMDKPIEEPSPYSPVSRLLWNEVFVDPTLSEEWPASEAAHKIVDSSRFQTDLKRQRATKLVDYRGVAKLKRQVMEILAGEFFERGGDRTKEFKTFLREKPLVESYAEFRAVCDKTGKVWQEWPERLRNGKLRRDDYNEKDRRFYLYGQWLAHQQLATLSKSSRAGGLGIYLDFPLSVHASGFDVWKERESFGMGASAGCPPDTNHPTGQDWGILPLHPGNSRKTGYRYFRACIESQMRYCGLLRLDHVMSLYRLYWVPQGLGAKNGAYVYYNVDELFAILTLESHRNECMLIGEDLGTVPPQIRTNMERHEVMRMYVQQRALKSDPKEPLNPEPVNAIASLNTHDMPPFAAFWQGLDIKDKAALGHIDKKQVGEKIKARQALQKLYVSFLRKNGLLNGNGKDLKSVMEAAHMRLARGKARTIIVNIEDLWLETNPQNVPATWKERPNWRRKLKYSIEEIAANQQWFDFMRKVVRARREGPKF